MVYGQEPTWVIENNKSNITNYTLPYPTAFYRNENVEFYPFAQMSIYAKTNGAVPISKFEKNVIVCFFLSQAQA